MSLIYDDTYHTVYRTANLPSSTAFTIAGWFYLTGTTSAATWNNLFFIADAFNGTPTNHQGTSHWQGTATYRLRDTQNTGVEFTSDPTANAWVYLAYVCSGTGAADAKAYWWNSSGSLQETVTATGLSFSPTHVGVGAQNGQNFKGYAAYLRVWDAALSTAELAAELASTSIVRTTNINTALGTASATTDVSGNSRTWTAAGVTVDSSGNYEPPSFTSKYLKLLAHSSAASAANIEGVVLNAAGDTVIGEFSSQAFDAALVGTEAQLLVPVASISPDGATLTTADTPLAVAYNATYTTGLLSCTVVEV